MSPRVPLVIATRNSHKVAEIQAILGDRFTFLSLAQLPQAPHTVEDASTFAGNAAKKALDLARWIDSAQPPVIEAGPFLVLADDSGLEVDALNGAPGVYSARFAAMDSAPGGNSRDVDNNAKLLRLLREVPDEKRTARFHCVIAVVEANPQSAIGNPHLFEGVCEGHIGFESRGKGGFGYDPLFTPIGYDRTFAELGEEVKNRLSHRARALEQSKAWLENVRR
jgi:XTP/dITP diphosphohydrolase